VAVERKDYQSVDFRQVAIGFDRRVEVVDDVLDHPQLQEKAGTMDKTGVQ
jgi:hypothetical protein